MTYGRLIFGATVVIGFMVTVFAWTPSAQAPSAVSPTTDSDLLVEIRGLRSDLNHALGANIRAQLLVGRLQLQEQRINVLSGQLAEVRRGLVAVEAGQVTPATEVQRMEETLRVGSLPAGAERDVERMISQFKAQLTQAQREEQRLRTEEAELAAQVDAELSRWTVFNERLDDIERTLPPATPLDLAR
jgi:hypothetical protein